MKKLHWLRIAFGYQWKEEKSNYTVHKCSRQPSEISVFIRKEDAFYTVCDSLSGGYDALLTNIRYCPYCGEHLRGAFI